MQVHIRGRNTGGEILPHKPKIWLIFPHYLTCTPSTIFTQKTLIFSFSCSFSPFWPKCTPNKPTPIGTPWTCMRAGKYIYVTWIFLAQGVFWHSRTQYLCVTEEELLYDSCERGFDLS